MSTTLVTLFSCALDTMRRFRCYVHLRSFYLTYPVPCRVKDQNRRATRLKTRDVIVMLK